MLLSALLLLCLVGPASAAGEPGEATGSPASAAAPAEVAPDPSRRLEAAIVAFQSGDPAAARRQLQDLLAEGPALPVGVRREAMAWLGEILLAEQGLSAARSTFEAILGEEPDFVMDPFRHSPDTCAAFEDVRRGWLARRPVDPLPRPEAPVTPRGPWPRLLLVPGGVYYFKESRPVPGALVGVTQVAAVTISAVTAVQMSQRRGEIDADDEIALRQYRNLSTVNVVASVVGYTAYLAPIVVESARWASKPRVQVGPTGVTVSGSF